MIDFASIGSVNNYIKNMGMQQNWNRKQQTGSFQPDGAKTIGEWVEKQKQSINEAKKEPKEDKLLNDIKNKLSSGNRLLSSELEYLQKNDFETYKQARAAETERNIYERELRMCRTKEDVQKYKLAHTARALENVKSAMNSGGAKEDKLEAVMGEQKKMSAINAAEKDFVKSGEYSKLPSQAEKLKVERDLRRAKKEESRAAAEKKKEKKAAEQAHSEKIKQKREEQRARLEKKKKIKKFKKRKKFTASKAKYTTAQALNTTEAKKVRRANAKAAYEQSSIGIAIAYITSAAKDMDIKA